MAHEEAEPEFYTDQHSTDAELAEDLRVADGATPGPWQDAGYGFVTAGDGVPEMNPAVIRLEWDRPHGIEDAAFIARSRTRYPALAAEVLRLRAELAEVTARLDISRLNYQLAEEMAGRAEAMISALMAERDAALDERERLRAATEDVENEFGIHEDAPHPLLRSEAGYVIRKLRAALEQAKG